MSERKMAGKVGAHLWDGIPQVWNADRDEVLVCRHIRQETHDVKTFVFSAREPRLFRHRPGQFLTLELDIAGQPVNRCYTIASAPTRPDTVSITVKRKVGGVVSNWLHDTLKPGDTVKILPATGDFSCTLHPADKYLFLSGGSGVTPLMSMARTFYDAGEDKDIVFVHSARSPRDIIFRHELAAMATGTANFRTAFICEQLGEERHWGAPLGQLGMPLLKSIAPDLMQRTIFCCGPEPYMAAVRAMLKDAGFAMDHYHEESFSFERQGVPLDVVEAKADAEAAALGKTFKIEFTRLGRTIECRPDQFILDAAKAAGMRLPFSCAKGVCGTCKSKKLSGDVDMRHGGGIRQREIDAGMILPCCSKPLSDVTLEK